MYQRKKASALWVFVYMTGRLNISRPDTNESGQMYMDGRITDKWSPNLTSQYRDGPQRHSLCVRNSCLLVSGSQLLFSINTLDILSYFDSIYCIKNTHIYYYLPHTYPHAGVWFRDNTRGEANAFLLWLTDKRRNLQPFGGLHKDYRRITELYSNKLAPSVGPVFNLSKLQDG